jgi:GNAT superfamily N-acetyltransferase
MTIEEYGGPRSRLRALFELAEDSSHVLDAYIDDGRVLVAFERDQPIGHLQLTYTDEPATAEVKNMAVLAAHERRGIGSALMAAAIALARKEGRSTLIVATATADVDNLRFYQRLGFRILRSNAMRSPWRPATRRTSTSMESLSATGCGWTSQSTRRCNALNPFATVGVECACLSSHPPARGPGRSPSRHSPRSRSSEQPHRSRRLTTARCSPRPTAPPATPSWPSTAPPTAT